MPLDVFISVNNWKILTQKVSYEFLVVIMVWRSDLFSILICSAWSSLKVNALHHWSHKALLEDLRAELVHGYFSFSWIERLWMSFLMLVWTDCIYRREKNKNKNKCMLYTCFSRDRPPEDAESSFLFGSVLLPSACLFCNIGNHVYGPPFQYLILASCPVGICEKTGGLETFGENLSVYSVSQTVSCHSNIKASLSLYFVFINVIIL